MTIQLTGDEFQTLRKATVLGLSALLAAEAHSDLCSSGETIQSNITDAISALGEAFDVLLLDEPDPESQKDIFLKMLSLLGELQDLRAKVGTQQ